MTTTYILERVFELLLADPKHTGLTNFSACCQETNRLLRDRYKFSDTGIELLTAIKSDSLPAVLWVLPRTREVATKHRNYDPLTAMVVFGSAKLLEAVLAANPTLDVTVNRNAPIRAAICEKSLESVQALLTDRRVIDYYLANTTVVDVDLLGLTSHFGTVAIFQAIAAQMPEPRIRSNTGRHYLSSAICSNNVELVEYLLNNYQYDAPLLRQFQRENSSNRRTPGEGQSRQATIAELLEVKLSAVE